MSDEAEDRPKRKYTRRSILENETAIEALGVAIANTVDESAKDAGAEDYDVEISEIEVEDIEPDPNAPLKVIGREPTGRSAKAEIVKANGTSDTMKYTPWRGKDMWSCSICSWSTFEKRRARRHCCE